MVALSTEDKKKLIAASVARAKQKQERQAERFVDFLSRIRVEDAAASPPQEVPFELWDYLEERAHAWGRGDSEIILKARQQGFSTIAAAYTAFVIRQPHARVLIISQGEREAYEFLEKVKYICRSAGIRLDKDNAGYIKASGGGEARALPSTEDAGRGYTATLVIVDEAASHPWAEKNAEAYLPTVADGGQVIIISTSKGAAGWFYEMYQKARQASLTPVFVPWWARPGRTGEWMEQQRHRYSKQGFMREYPASEEEAFQAAQGLVYGGAFEWSQNVRADHPLPWEECNYRYAAYDLGGGDPTALVMAGVYQDVNGQGRLHIYDIAYWNEGAPSVEQLYAELAPWHDRAPFSEIFGDPVPGGETIRNSLGAMGLPVRRANNHREVGIDVVRLMMEKNWLTVVEDVAQGVWDEVHSYRYRERSDQHTKEKYLTSTPQDHHADRLDAIRYLCMGAYTDMWNNLGRRKPQLAYTGIQW